SDWITDKNADEFASDGFGGQNSVVVVGNFDYLKIPAKKGDNKIIEEALFFDTSIQYFNPVTKDKILFIIQTRADDITKSELILNPGSNSEKIIPLYFVSSNNGLDFYEAMPTINSREVTFLFKVQDGSKVLYLDSKEISKTKNPKNAFNVNLDKIEIFETPDWVKEAIVYQIFPERFYNGDISNDPLQDKRRPDGQAWNISDSYLEDWETGKPSWGNYFGGDLIGVEKKLSYIKELGITAIYFNPVFESLSNHKYDTIDYYKIDDNFGSNEQFKNLVDKLHSMGVKVILDGVFNHTADEFIQFEDIKKQGPKSKYYKWYNIKKWPFPENFSDKNKPADYYDCWWGFGDLPKLNTDNDEVKKLLLDVSEYWIKEMGIDGWRLDVPNEIPHPFWKEFRKVVKGANPEAYIVGEIWDNAYAWLKGDEFDAVMNYRFRTACIDFFAKRSIPPSEFHKRIMETMLDYPRQAYYVLLNLLDSHDTIRFLTECKGDKKRFKLAVFCQLTMPGTPMIYYGDELGMDGGKDPDNRKTMVWDESKQDRDMLEFYKKLIKLRKENPALSIGEFFPFYINDKTNIYSYVRKNDDDIFIIILNNTTNSNEVMFQINRLNPDTKTLLDLMNDNSHSINNGVVKISLKPNSGYIFKLQN
ncbi:alpha amylase N-terminal ig-like domain-containing protein, partial [Candidatus Dependentiae bacterium]|nr:alpha amylase N-terminal ig-like domain-containing protein [Candidatus Dependentiae bacterium]